MIRIEVLMQWQKAAMACTFQRAAAGYEGYANTLLSMMSRGLTEDCDEARLIREVRKAKLPAMPPGVTMRTVKTAQLLFIHPPAFVYSPVFRFALTLELHRCLLIALTRSHQRSLTRKSTPKRFRVIEALEGVTRLPRTPLSLEFHIIASFALGFNAWLHRRRATAAAQYEVTVNPPTTPPTH